MKPAQPSASAMKAWEKYHATHLRATYQADHQGGMQVTSVYPFYRFDITSRGTCALKRKLDHDP